MVTLRVVLARDGPENRAVDHTVADYELVLSRTSTSLRIIESESIHPVSARLEGEQLVTKSQI